MWPRVTTVLSHGRRTACPGLGCLGELTHPMRVAMGEILYGTPQNGCFKMVLFGETVIDHRFIFFLPSFFSDRHFSGMMWLDITGQPHGPSDSLQGIPIHNQSTAAGGCRSSMELSIFLGMLKVEPPFLWGVELEAPILGVLARCQMVSSRVSVFFDPHDDWQIHANQVPARVSLGHPWSRSFRSGNCRSLCQ